VTVYTYEPNSKKEASIKNYRLYELFDSHTVILQSPGAGIRTDSF